MRRMTPAKLLILMDNHRELLATQEQPIAAIACMFYNANRNPGDPAKGIPAAELKPVDEFLMFKKRKGTRTLAAKDGPGGRHNLDGAIVDRGAWESWAKGKAQPTVHRR